MARPIAAGSNSFAQGSNVRIVRIQEGGSRPKVRLLRSTPGEPCGPPRAGFWLKVLSVQQDARALCLRSPAIQVGVALKRLVIVISSIIVLWCLRLLFPALRPTAVF